MSEGNERYRWSNVRRKSSLILQSDASTVSGPGLVRKAKEDSETEEGEKQEEMVERVTREPTRTHNIHA